MMIQIQKYFGTSLWMYRAGTRSNHFKISRTGMRVFSGLFHINGNHNYSQIELYDDYLMSTMEQKNPELFDPFLTRMVTNLKNEPYCSESHDEGMMRLISRLRICFLAKILKNLTWLLE